MTSDRHLAEALRKVKLENAQLINRFRAVGVGSFTVLSILMVFNGHISWEPPLFWLVPYFVIALILMIGGSLNPKILGISRFAVPVFDVPMVTGLQLVSVWWEVSSSGNPEKIAEFTVALFVCMLMLSAMTLNSGQIWISLITVIAAEQILQHEALMNFPNASTIPAIFVFVLAAWICLVAGRKRLRLVSLLSEGETRSRRLQRYFSPGIGELLEQQSGGDLELGQDHEITVIFSDIRGFTAMSEGMTSREVVTLLNTFHARMVEAIFRHGGTLDKYIGDGLMAYFNAPVGQPDHAERAFKCSMEMCQGLAALNTERSWTGNQELRMGIGIHTGRAIVGDIGAPHRREFTAIGDAVNVTARIEEFTKEIGREVLISETTAALLPEGVLLTDVGVQSLRGSSKPLRLFTPDKRSDAGKSMT